MEKVVINKGPIQVKKDGVLYEISSRQFNEIKALIFEYDTPICRLCKNSPKCRKAKDSDFITNGLTTTKRPDCQFVFDCEKFESSLDEEHIIGPVEYIPNPKFSPQQINNAKYAEAMQLLSINESKKKYFRNLRK